MAIAEILTIVALVGGAVWQVSEKIGALREDMDRRLDELKERQIFQELEGANLRERLQEMETKHLEWFQRLNKEIYKCTIPPQE